MERQRSRPISEDESDNSDARAGRGGGPRGGRGRNGSIPRGMDTIPTLVGRHDQLEERVNQMEEQVCEKWFSSFLCTFSDFSYFECDLAQKKNGDQQFVSFKAKFSPILRVLKAKFDCTYKSDQLWKNQNMVVEKILLNYLELIVKKI